MVGRPQIPFLRTIPVFSIEPTATPGRQIVFALLLLMALVDAAATASEWAAAGAQDLGIFHSALLGIAGFIGSLLLSLLFLALIGFAWDWISIGIAKIMRREAR